jgi:hypothetical protein
MPDSSLQVGDRVRYVEGLISGAKRKGAVGTITSVFSDGTGSPFRADVEFDDGVEEGVSVALLELA